MPRWMERLNELDRRVVGPVKLTHTDRDYFSGDWLYLVEPPAIVISLVAFFAIIGAGIGILALCGFAPNRFVAFAIGAVIGPAIWQRYTRHHYRRQYQPGYVPPVLSAADLVALRTANRMRAAVHVRWASLTLTLGITGVLLATFLFDALANRYDSNAWDSVSLVVGLSGLFFGFVGIIWLPAALLKRHKLRE